MENKETILEELGELAPGLLKNKMKVQQYPHPDYFEKMQDSVLAKIMEKDYADIPNGYFQSMQNQVIASTSPVTKTKVFRLSPYVKWASAACAALLMMWIPYNYTSNKTVKENSELTLDVSNEEELDYIVEYFNSEADLHYLSSITNEESLIEEATEYDPLLSDEEIELLNEIM
jgi:hypothetical protein